MSKIFKFAELPETEFLANEQEKALPPVEGREIITRTMDLGTREVPQNGYHQRYTFTMQELTVLVDHMWRERKKEIQEMRRIQSELRFYWKLPERVEKFMEDVAAQLTKYREEQTATLEHVSQVLDDLLDGKAKPSGDMMSLILDAIEGQKTRLATLENKVTALFSGPPAQGASRARSENGGR